MTIHPLPLLSVLWLAAPSSAAPVPGPGDTLRVSLTGAGQQGNERSSEASISADGRFVAFISYSSDLVPGDTNGSKDVFVRDRLAGSTTRVSVSSAGAQANMNCEFPRISADGRYVFFETKSSTLVSGDTNNSQDIFRHDRNSGQTIRVTVGPGGVQSNAHSYTCDVTSNGRYLTFESSASNLVAGGGGVNLLNIFLRDLQTGDNTLLSVSSAGGPSDGNSRHPVISSDGRYVAFESLATNLVTGDTNGQPDVFVRDLVLGQTTRVSLSSTGTQGNSFSQYPSISADGRWVTFEARASTLVLGDNNSVDDIFLHDRQTGETTLISRALDGTPASYYSNNPSISADGSRIAYQSWAADIVPSDLNASNDIFVYELATDTSKRISLSSAEQEGLGHSTFPDISADGRFVAFTSAAANLVPGDTNAHDDIFVHEYVAGPNIGTPFCFGDGSSAPCPCSNFSGPGVGCGTSTGAGALLTASGSVSVAADDLSLRMSGLPANQLGLFYMGGGQTALPFGDGLRCVASGGVGLHRFYSIAGSGPAGSITNAAGIVAHSQANFPLSGQIAAGDSWHFQGWFRDPAGPCGLAYNLTNGLTITFVP